MVLHGQVFRTSRGRFQYRRVDEAKMQSWQLVDHPKTADELSAFACSNHVEFDVLMKVDCGNHGSGLDPKAPESADIARHIVGKKGLRFLVVFCLMRAMHTIVKIAKKRWLLHIRSAT